MSSPLNRPRRSVRPPVESRRPVDRLRLLAAAACVGVLAPLAGVGCDNASAVAERNLQAQLEEVRGAKPAPQGELPVVPASLVTAVGQASNAPPETRAEALAWLAQAEVRRAAALLDRAGREEIGALRLASESNRIAARLQSNGVIITGLQKLEPTQERTTLQQQRGAVQGEQDPVWRKHETGPIPALKGAEDRIARLQEQIGKLEQQAKAFGDQRAQLLNEAERLERQSEGAAGKQSVDLFNRGSEARKRAADLSVQGEAVEAQLVPLRQDLQLAQNEQKQLAKAVHAFESRLQTAEQTWKSVQQQIDATAALSKRLVGPGPNEPAAPPPAFGAVGASGSGGAPEAVEDAPPAPATAPAGGTTPPARPAAGGGKVVFVPTPASLVGKLRWLSAVSKSVEAQRAEAETLLNSALDHYKAAGAAAGQLVSSIGQRTGSNTPPEERANWDRVAALHNPSEYKLKQAAVQLMIAGLQRDRAASLAARATTAKNVAAALQANKLPPPQELAEHNVDAEVNKAREAASAAYKEADGALTEVVEARGSDAMKAAARAAHSLRLAGLYGQAQLAAQTDPRAADRLMAQAKQVASQADGQDLPAPAALPAFLRSILDIRPATPATAPAGTGAGTTAAPAPGAVAPGTVAPGPATPPAPAPGTTPDTAAPAPDTATPAPDTAAPAPDTAAPPADTAAPAAPEQPAPGTEGAAPPPAPDAQQPAPEGQQPAPEGQQPAPEGQQPAPEGQQPAPEGQQVETPPADAGAQPAGSEQSAK